MLFRSHDAFGQTQFDNQILDPSQVRGVGRIARADLSADHQQFCVLGVRERADERLAAFGFVEKAEIAEERLVIANAESGAPRGSLVVGWWGGWDVGTNRDERKLSHVPGRKSRVILVIRRDDGIARAREIARDPIAQDARFGKEVRDAEVVKGNDKLDLRWN